MRKTFQQLPIVIISIVAVIGCDGASGRPHFFARSQWSSPVQCPRIGALDGMSAVTDVIAVTDSTFAVVLGDERKLLLFGPDYQRLDSLTFGKDGPRGVLHAASAVVTDTLIVVADDARSLLRFFTRAGEDAGTLPLTFVPRRLRMAGATLVVSPLVAGGSPAHLAFELRGRTPHPLGGAVSRYDDIGVNTLANMTSVAAFPGRVVVMHETVVPFGYVLHPGRPASLAERFAVPMADEVRDRVGRLPQERLTDRNVNDLAVVAFTAAPDLSTGSVYYVTRGAKARGSYRKFVVRLDSMLAVADVVPIDVHPQHMAHIEARRILIVVNNDSEWFECRMP